jgi:hypothetical protein
MRIAVKAATCSDGIAQPPQLAWRSTPNGRGRRAKLASHTVRVAPRFETTSQTIRCRQRRNTSKASGRAKYSASSGHQEPMRARPRRNGTTPGPARPASQRTTASSTTVTATAGPRSPRAKMARVSPTSTTAATSQPTPLVWSR